MTHGGIASLSRFKIDRSAKKAHGWQNTLFDVRCWTFDVGRSMFISFFSDQTGRSRPEASLL